MGRGSATKWPYLSSPRTSEALSHSASCWCVEGGMKRKAMPMRRSGVRFGLDEWAMRTLWSDISPVRRFIRSAVPKLVPALRSTPTAYWPPGRI